MSPSSAGRAEKLGYTNVKVYHDGLPEWTRKHAMILPAQSLKEAFLDKDIPAVILDVRRSADASKGFIKGAVGMPAATVAANITAFPARDKKPPIIIIDDKGGSDAETAARALTTAGYTSVAILSGGMDAWRAAGFPLETGAPGTVISYTPKPRPGEVTIDEFRKIATAIPADTIILDVRNREEVASGMISGAVAIPDEELLDRIAELPRNKQIIAHCSTGVRAEMAYHKLKQKGYSAGFLNARIDINRDGSFTAEKM